MLWLVDLLESTFFEQLAVIGQLTGVRLQPTVRLQFCRLIRAIYSSLCTNHIWENCNCNVMIKRITVYNSFPTPPRSILSGRTDNTPILVYTPGKEHHEQDHRLLFWVNRGAIRVKCFAHKHDAVTWLWPWILEPYCSALWIRSTSLA